MDKKHMGGHDIVPVHSPEKISFSALIDNYSKTCFEARNVADGARLFKAMVKENDTIWLGIAGAGIVGGLGGYVIDLIKKGFIDVICTTGAQAYHDLHFAYGLPMKQGCPKADDNVLRSEGIIRVYDIFLDESKTLLAQDKKIREFASKIKLKNNFSSADFNYALGKFVLKNAKFPERSFLAEAAKHGVPIYYDSNSNHSIALNNAASFLDGKSVNPSSMLDVLESAAIAYSSEQEGFVELGGGGPKNFIQQTGPTIQQILGIDFKGADRGLQITTAIERDGGLSSCTFSEGVSWGKYKDASKNLVQIFSEYSIVFPLITGYVLENCNARKHKKLMENKREMLEKLKKDRKQ